MHDWGPPWALNINIYEELLDANWEQIRVYEVPAEESREVGYEEVLDDAEVLIVWRKRS